MKYAFWGSIVSAILLAGGLWIASRPGHAFEGCTIGRKHHNAWMQIISTGKTTVPIYHPERWEIRLESDDGAKHWHNVNEDIYEWAGREQLCFEAVTRTRE